MKTVTQETIDAIYKGVAEVAIGFINGENGMPPQEATHQVLFFDVRDDGTYFFKDAFPEELMKMTFGDPVGKKMLPIMVQTVLSGVGGKSADVCAVVTEAWAVMTKDTEVINAIKESGKPIAEHPDRVETLVVVIYTRERSQVGVMPIITTDGKRHVTFRPPAAEAAQTGNLMAVNDPGIEESFLKELAAAKKGDK